jgi:[acyl-carrier-protein] S-malonyltransferase
MEAQRRKPGRSPQPVALLFPGQGSQLVGMGRAFAAASGCAGETFEEADDVLGFSIRQMCFEGPEEQLKRTENAQPALLTVGVTILRELQRVWAAESDPVAGLGHSLGEWSALVAAGALRFSDALRLVRLRGERMASACTAVDGGMLAVLGLESEAVADVCRSVGEVSVVVANLNAPRQVVLSGLKPGLELLEAPLRAAGARELIPLKVSGPFHSPWMAGAAKELEAALRGVPLSRPRYPVLSCVTGLPHEDPESIRSCLVEQLTSPVRWEACMRWALDHGAACFLELGPGRVLAGLARWIDRKCQVVGISDPASLAVWTGRQAGSPASQERCA